MNTLHQILLPAFLAIALAFCGSPQLLLAQVYTDLHDFDCSVEGCQPTYPEILAQGRDGDLYGTTDGGGTSGMGTVFKMTPLGVVTTIYNFSGLDGQNPDAGLVLGTDGNFYGTTRFGGTSNFGTVFKITPAGVLTALHSFNGPMDQTRNRGWCWARMGVSTAQLAGSILRGRRTQSRLQAYSKLLTPAAKLSVPRH